MKVFTALLALTLASAATQTEAATCSASDITGVTKLPQYAAVLSACDAVDFANPLAGAATICSKATCVDALRSYAQALPKCEVNGVSFAANFDAAISNCKASSPAAPVTAVPTTKPIETPVTTTKPVETPVSTTKPVVTSTSPSPKPVDTTTKPPVETPSPKDAGSAGNGTSAGVQNGTVGESDKASATTSTTTPTPTTTTPASAAADKKSAAASTKMSVTAVTVASVAMLSASFL